MDGIELKVQRIRACLRQYELAARAGLREGELSLIETGRKLPSEEKLARILQALGTARRAAGGG